VPSRWGLFAFGADWSGRGASREGGPIGAVAQPARHVNQSRRQACGSHAGLSKPCRAGWAARAFTHERRRGGLWPPGAQRVREALCPVLLFRRSHLQCETLDPLRLVDLDATIVCRGRNRYKGSRYQNRV
jgi:hypothetical protein